MRNQVSRGQVSRSGRVAYKVLRGCYWGDDAAGYWYPLASDRGGAKPGARINDLGFRLVLR